MKEQKPEMNKTLSIVLVVIINFISLMGFISSYIAMLLYFPLNINNFANVFLFAFIIIGIIAVIVTVIF